MFTPLWIAVAWTASASVQAQQGTTPTVPPVASSPVLQVPSAYTFPSIQVLDLVRLPLTPVLDGKLDPEEWDPFATTTSGQTYLQWERDTLYVAASGPADSDLVVTLDLKGDGWLVGKDNLEIRIKPPVLAGEAATVSARILDATNPQGPTWVETPGFKLSSKISRAVSGTSAVTEVAISDPGLDLLPTFGSKVGGRVDLIPAGSPEAEAFRPRTLPQLTFARARGAALPTGLRFGYERADVPLVPGERGFIRLTFNGTDALGLKRIDLRSEGYAKETTTTVGYAFPSFDSKGRAFVDYSPNPAKTSSLGFRLLRATLGTADGVPGIIQISYRSAPLIDIDVIRKRFPASDKDRALKLAIYVESNSIERVEGELTLSLPLPFKVLNSTEKQKILVGESRSRLRRSFDVFAPANLTGTFPMEFTVTANGKTVKQTGYLVIGGSS